MTQQQRTQWSNTIVVVGLLLMVMAAVLNLFIAHQGWLRWPFAGGALLVLVARILGVTGSGTLRVKRLHRILISSGILYCASAAMLFIPGGGNNWIAFLLAGVVMQIYASWMIERESTKN